MNGPVTFPLPLQQMMDSLYPPPITVRSAGFCPLFSLLSHAETEVVVKQICFYGAKHCETELIRA